MVLTEQYGIIPYLPDLFQRTPPQGATGGFDGQTGGYRQQREVRHHAPAFQGAHYLRYAAEDEGLSTTYTKARRLASSGLSDIGAFVDTYA